MWKVIPTLPAQVIKGPQEWALGRPRRPGESQAPGSGAVALRAVRTSYSVWKVITDPDAAVSEGEHPCSEVGPPPLPPTPGALQPVTGGRNAESPHPVGLLPPAVHGGHCRRGSVPTAWPASVPQHP